MNMNKIPPPKRIELAEKNLQRVIDWISNSDKKVGVIMAFQVGLTAFFITTRGSDIKTIIITQTFDFPHFILYFSVVIFGFFLIKSVFYAFKSLYPDIAPKESSLFFFGSIAPMGIDKFKKAMTSLTEEEAEEELNKQTYINSEIALAKFNNLRLSITSLLVAAFFWVVTLILIPILLR